FTLDVDSELGDQVRVQSNLYRVFAHCLQCTIRHTHFGLFDCTQTIALDGTHDVHGCDRTKQAAVDTGFLGNSHGDAVELFGLGLCSDQLFSLRLLKFGATCLDLFQGVGRGTACHFLRDQIVARIAAAHTDHIAQITKINNFFEQNYLHDDNPRIICDYRCKASVPENGHA